MNMVVVPKRLPKQFIAALFLATASCASQPSQDDEQMADTYVRLAEEHLARGLYSGAIVELDSAEQLNRRHPRLHATRALAMIGMQRWNDAKSAIESAEDLVGTNSEIRLLWSELYIQSNEPKKALPMIDLILDDPRFTHRHLAYTNSGRALLILQQNEKALAQFEKAIQLASDHCDIRILKTKTLLRLKRNKEAIRFAGAATRFCPQHFGTHLWYVYALSRGGRSQQALAHLGSIRTQGLENFQFEILQNMAQLVRNKVPLEEPQMPWSPYQ